MGTLRGTRNRCEHRVVAPANRRESQRLPDQIFDSRVTSTCCPSGVTHGQRGSRAPGRPDFYVPRLVRTDRQAQALATHGGARALRLSDVHYRTRVARQQDVGRAASAMVTRGPATTLRPRMRVVLPAAVRRERPASEVVLVGSPGLVRGAVSTGDREGSTYVRPDARQALSKITSVSAARPTRARRKLEPAVVPHR